MKDRLNFDEDILNELILNVPSHMELNDNNEFEFSKDENVMSDEDFDSLLKKLGINEDDEQVNPMSVNSFSNEKKLEYNSNDNNDVMLNRIELERELLRLEREKFECEKKEWENYKRISELSLQSAKDEFEKYRENEIKRMDLETKRIANGCANLKELFENYIKALDVSE